MGGLSQRAVRWASHGAWRIRMVSLVSVTGDGVRVNDIVIKTLAWAWPLPRRGCERARSAAASAVEPPRTDRRSAGSRVRRSDRVLQFGGRRGSSARSPSPGPGRGSPHARCAHDALARQTSDQHAPCLRGIFAIACLLSVSPAVVTAYIGTPSRSYGDVRPPQAQERPAHSSILTFS